MKPPPPRLPLSRSIKADHCSNVFTIPPLLPVERSPSLCVFVCVCFLVFVCLFGCVNEILIPLADKMSADNRDVLSCLTLVARDTNEVAHTRTHTHKRSHIQSGQSHSGLGNYRGPFDLVRSPLKLISHQTRLCSFVCVCVCVRLLY